MSRSFPDAFKAPSYYTVLLCCHLKNLPKKKGEWIQD